MFQVVFALLMAAGAFAAWRHNPIYSTRSTLKFIAGFGATAIGVVAALIAVTEAAPKLPTAVAFASIGTVTFLGMLLLIWTIIELTSPRVPPLPPGAPHVYRYRGKLGRWALRLFLALVVFGVASAILRGDVQILVASFGAFTAFIGLTLLFTSYVTAERFDKSLAVMEADPWIHWRYTPAYWQAWSTAEAERRASTPRQFVWRRDWKRTLWVIVPTIVLVSIFDPGEWSWKAAYLGALLVLGIAIIEASNRSERSAPRRLRAMLMNSAPESYMGSAGVFSDGMYTEWLTVSNYLLDATIDEQAPRSIALRFEVTTANGTPVHVPRYVLLPEHQDADLDRLQRLLSARCPTANVALSDLAREETSPGATVAS